MALQGTLLAGAPRRPPPPAESHGLAEAIRRGLFGSPLNTVITIICILLVGRFLPEIVSWGLIRAVWYSPDASACKVDGAGACWAIVPEKFRLIFFGTYPYDEQWRAAFACVLMVGACAVAGVRRLWSRALVVAWFAVMLLALVLLYGGVLGLLVVDTRGWGGLPLTLVLFIGSVIAGFPLAVVLALGRVSDLPAVKAVCTGVIELVRGVPLVGVLFMASLLMPLFMPGGITIDKVLRAGIGMTVFFGAYSAEVIRGGLQAIPRGQYEAADALGLSYWTRTRRIVLPQALRIVLPALVGDIVRAFKNTTFVSIIGLYDILGATRSAINDPVWIRFAIEFYLFVFALYFVVCYALSLYSAWLERTMPLRKV